MNVDTITLLSYASMPFISAFVGWITNVIALEMMFYPIHFVGIKPIFGWQGVVPRKGKKMATISVDLLMNHLIKLEELADRIDEQAIGQLLKKPLMSHTREIVNTVMDDHMPMAWAALPDIAKEGVYQRIRREIPLAVEEMVEAFKANPGQYIDLKAMLIDKLEDDKTLLVKIFQEIGHSEFSFIRKSGLYFGFVFGCIQMLIWTQYQGIWVLPIAGALVGFLTNWLAIKIIFNPKKPIKIGPWVFHGLFLKRQQEVAEDYGRLAAKEFITPHNIIEHMLMNAQTSDHLLQLVEKHTHKAINQVYGASKPVMVMLMGSNQYLEIKAHVTEKLLSILPDTLRDPALQTSTHQALDIEHLLSERMRELTTEQFVGMLRPAFEEDEWILILVGALLGCGVGIFQFMVLFGGQFT